jgi:ATP-dependent 26S proteasome regulatory subunit
MGNEGREERGRHATLLPFALLYYSSSVFGLNLTKFSTFRSPSVIFLDEVDVLCQRRSGSGTQLEQRLVAALLAEIDGMQNQRVMIMAATSRPDAIDESLRRPGRLDREIELPVPGPNARNEILQCMLTPVPHNLTQEEVSSIIVLSITYL